MPAFPVPAKETERLEALRRFRRSEDQRSESIDRITRLAAYICRTPIGNVTLIVADRQVMLSAVGMERIEIPREQSFCAHTIMSGGIMIVEDARADARFASNPLVTGPQGIRFYAGAPLVTSDYHNLGSLCVIDSVPRTLDPEQKEALASLSALVMSELNLRETAADLADALREVKALRDFLPTCSFCGKIRNEQNEWSSLEEYIMSETTSKFSHGLCPVCARVHYPGIDLSGGRGA
jgi:GAF domain-containing protein